MFYKINNIFVIKKENMLTLKKLGLWLENYSVTIL
jgi:hypothetical protein